MQKQMPVDMMGMMRNLGMGMMGPGPYGMGPSMGPGIGPGMGPGPGMGMGMGPGPMMGPAMGMGPFGFW